MKKALALLGLLLVELCVLGQVGLKSAKLEKHFIGHSWDLLKVSTDDIVRNLPALEKLPLDGITISLFVSKQAGAKPVCTRNVISDPPWQREWYKPEIEKIRKISSGKLKQNLLVSMFAPSRRVPWTDDAAWERAARNAEVLAWVAKESGAKGILLDPEDYPRTKQYSLQPDDPPYRETAALARKRGGQLMKAMGTQYPDLVLLSFWLLSMRPGLYLDIENPLEEAEAGGDLWCHFINGLLDELPEGAILVDASENGYRHTAKDYEFLQTSWGIIKRAVHLISPENRMKFYNQYQTGFGLYLDMYTNGEGSIWYHPATDGSRLRTLFLNFSQAMQCADQYCWVYGEKFSWIKWDCADRLQGNPLKVNPETWEDKLPGFTKTMKLIVNADAACKEIYDELAKAGKLVNLVSNPECTPGKKGKIEGKAEDWNAGNLPEGWSFWRENEKEGTFGLDSTKGLGDNFSAKATGITRGCFILKVNVKPGQVYAVEAWKQGGELSRLSVRWQFNNRWVVEQKDKTFQYAKEKNAEGWQKALGFVTVPGEANQLLLLIGTGLKPEETAWYDKAGVSLIQ